MKDNQPGLTREQARKFYEAIADAKARLRFAEELCYECDERIMARIVRGLADTVQAIHGVDIRQEENK